MPTKSPPPSLSLPPFLKPRPLFDFPPHISGENNSSAGERLITTPGTLLCIYRDIVIIGIDVEILTFYCFYSLTWSKAFSSRKRPSPERSVAMTDTTSGPLPTDSPLAALPSPVRGPLMVPVVAISLLGECGVDGRKSALPPLSPVTVMGHLKRVSAPPVPTWANALKSAHNGSWRRPPPPPRTLLPLLCSLSGGDTPAAFFVVASRDDLDARGSTLPRPWFPTCCCRRRSARRLLFQPTGRCAYGGTRFRQREGGWASTLAPLTHVLLGILDAWRPVTEGVGGVGG